MSTFPVTYNGETWSADISALPVGSTTLYIVHSTGEVVISTFEVLPTTTSTSTTTSSTTTSSTTSSTTTSSTTSSTTTTSSTSTSTTTSSSTTTIPPGTVTLPGTLNSGNIHAGTGSVNGSNVELDAGEYSNYLITSAGGTFTFSTQLQGASAEIWVDGVLKGILP